MLTHIIAFLVGAALASAGLWVGHYYWMPPRPDLRAPWTYVWGVAWCMAGAAVYVLWTHGAWLVWTVVFGVFAVGGACDFLAYHNDRRLHIDQHTADLEAENSSLRAQLAKVNDDSTETA